MVGGTKVNQTSQLQSTTNVSVDIANNIDTTALGEAVVSFGTNIKDVLTKFTDIEEKDTQTRAAQVLAALNGQKIEQNKTDTVKKIANIALGSTAIYLVWKGYKGAKKK